MDVQGLTGELWAVVGSQDRRWFKGVRKSFVKGLKGHLKLLNEESGPGFPEGVGFSSSSSSSFPHDASAHIFSSCPGGFFDHFPLLLTDLSEPWLGPSFSHHIGL
jgi:hypothetical protein